MNEPSSAKYLIFRAGEAHFALPAGQIREIVTDLPRFPVPFTPAWVRGVLNRHGEPFTILDIQMLLEGPPLDGRAYLLLNLANDQVAILISEVREITILPETCLHAISSTDAAHACFQAVLSISDAEIPVLNLDRILARLAEDVRTS